MKYVNRHEWFRYKCFNIADLDSVLVLKYLHAVLGQVSVQTFNVKGLFQFSGFFKNIVFGGYIERFCFLGCYSTHGIAWKNLE